VVGGVVQRQGGAVGDHALGVQQALARQQQVAHRRVLGNGAAALGALQRVAAGVLGADPLVARAPHADVQAGCVPQGLPSPQGLGADARHMPPITLSRVNELDL
jgi:hypothetical protein